MSAIRTIDQIDQAIDDLQAELLRRNPRMDETSCASWQAAWDAAPDLADQDRALFHERGIAQTIRARTAVPAM